MSKKSVVNRQKKREIIVKRHWEKRQALKLQAKDMSLSEEERHDARTSLNKMPRDGSAIRLRNRCELTGRPRGVMRKFKLSRLCFRELASMGAVPGVTKSSW